MLQCSRCGKYFFSGSLCQCGGTGEEYVMPVRRHHDPRGRDEHEEPITGSPARLRLPSSEEIAAKAAAIQVQEAAEDRFERSVIVSRHSGLIEWLRRRGIEAARACAPAAADTWRLGWAR